MLENIKILFKDRRRIRVISILCFLALYTTAHSFIQVNPVNPQQNTKVIHLRQAGYIYTRPDFEPQILVNDVILFHDGVLMYCDSAYLNEKENSFEAFGRIKVDQGDTLFMYGDYLFYDGNQKLLMVRNNVRLENNDVTLFTDSLDYDRVLNIGYYFEGGMMVDSLNELTSYWGQYEPNIKIATFSDSVKLINDRFTLYSDTLVYDTQTKIATILGPSTIVSDSGVIYSKRGWYNTITEESMLLDRSTVVNKEGNRILIGDSISYHKAEGYGEVFGNMFLHDTIKKVILCGNYGYYNEHTEYAMATDSAYSIEYSQGDSLFLHGDKLEMIRIDSTYREMKAYYGVRFYRSDIQGVCDSMQYNTKENVLYMYTAPVLWNENYQMVGDTIEVFMNDSTVDWIHMKQYCFAIEQKDSIHYNQLKGRDLKAYLVDGDMRYIIVEGNAQSIFYPEEEDGSIIGMNQTESSYLSMNLKDKKMEKLKLWPKVNARMTPLPDLTPDITKLPEFQWLDYIRPLNKDDIFRKAKRKEEPIRRSLDIFNAED